MENKEAKYEYYGAKSMFFTFLIIETIGVILYIFYIFLDWFILQILAFIVLAFGIFNVLSNFIGMYSLLYDKKKNKIILNQIVKLSNLSGNENILDIGCGRGRITILLAKQLKSGKIKAIDISEDVLNWAGKNAIIEKVEDKIDFKKSSIFSIPFEKSNFDLVTCAGVFNHLDENQIKQAITEIKRVLKKDGKFILFEMAKGLRGFMIYTILKFHKLKNKEQWEKIMQRYGFKINDTYEDRGRVLFLIEKNKLKGV